MSLREYVEDAGPGFCYAAIPEIFTSHSGHGPLLVAMDTNIVRYLAKYGEILLDEEGDPRTIDPTISEELEGQLYHLGSFVSMWLVRDIRFVVLPKGYSDYRKYPSTFDAVERLKDHHRRLDAITDALRFQVHQLIDRNFRSAEEFISSGQLMGGLEEDLSFVPAGADRTLVLESLLNGVDIFLTCDKKILHVSDIFRPRGLSILDPESAWLTLIDGVEEPLPFFAGRIAHDDCPYGWDVLMGDSGKWTYLLSALSDNVG